MRPHLIAISLFLAGIVPAYGGDLPPELVERPPTLPDGMVAVIADGGYESASVLGVRVRSDAAFAIASQWGTTDRLQLGLATGFEPAWNREAIAQLTYSAWRDHALELAPSLTVPLSFHTGPDLTSTIVFGAGVRVHAGRSVLVTIGQRLLPVPIRPAIALDLGADVAVTVQLAERLAATAQLALGEVMVVGQYDRGFAPWHRLPAAARIVYASEYRLDLAIELHADAIAPNHQYGALVEITRRL